jgi:hypothetical protein
MAAADLTTLQTVKEWLGLDPSNTSDDDLLSRLITAASGFMTRYCNRPFVSQACTEARDGTGSARMLFANYPVSAVASVTVNGQSIPPGSSVAAGFYFTDTVLVLNGYRFRRGYANVQVSYTAGFDPIPDEIEQACIELITFRYREKDRTGKASEGMAQQTTAFVIKDVPPAVKTMLDNLCRVIPV